MWGKVQNANRSREPGQKSNHASNGSFLSNFGVMVASEVKLVTDKVQCIARCFKVDGERWVPLSTLLCGETSTLPFSYLIGYMTLDYQAFCEDTTFNLYSKCQFFNLFLDKIKVKF